MKILRKSSEKITINNEFLKIYKQEIFIKGLILFNLENFTFIDTFYKDSFLYTDKKTILIQKQVFKKDRLLTHEIPGHLYNKKFLKLIFLLLKKNKKLIIPSKIIKITKKIFVINVLGLTIFINLNLLKNTSKDNLLKNCKTHKFNILSFKYCLFKLKLSKQFRLKVTEIYCEPNCLLNATI